MRIPPFTWKSVLFVLLGCVAFSAVQAIDPHVPAAAMKPVVISIAPPPAPVHDVRTYGAKGDGTTYDTVALQKAIDACAGTGGSVLLSKGTFLTAQIQLKGNMTFYIDQSAVLLGGTNPEDYPILVPTGPAKGMIGSACRRSILYANEAHKLILDGGGTIDGQCKLVRMSGKEPERPSLLRFFQSNDVVVRNLTMRNPRMWTQVYDHCNRLIIEGLKVVAPPDCPNLDGMDICDSHDVVIRNNEVNAEDDCICLKSHGPDGLQNVLIENNVIHCYRANGIKIGTATKGPIENIRILNNTVKHAQYGGLCLESVDGGAMKNILVQGLDLYRTAQPIFIRLGARSGDKPGSITDVHIENVRALDTHGKTAPSCTITGMVGVKVGNVRLKNIYLEMPGGLKALPKHPPERNKEYPQSNLFGNPPAYGFYVRHATSVVFENVTIGTSGKDVRPWLVAADAEVQTLGCTELNPLKPVPVPR